MEDLLVGYYLRRLVCFPWEVIGTNTCGGGYQRIHIVLAICEKDHRKF